MKLLRRLLVVLVLTVTAHGSFTVGAQAAKPGQGSSASSADLALTIEDRGTDPHTFFTELVYDVTVSNAGPATAGGTLELRLSGGKVTRARTQTCTLVSPVDVRCDLGSIPGGQFRYFDLDVKPDAPSRGEVSTSMSLSGVVYGNQRDPNMSNNQDSDSATAVADPTPPTPPLPPRPPLPPLPPLPPVPPLPFDPYCPLSHEIIGEICVPWIDWWW